MRVVTKHGAGRGAPGPALEPMPHAQVWPRGQAVRRAAELAGRDLGPLLRLQRTGAERRRAGGLCGAAPPASQHTTRRAHGGFSVPQTRTRAVSVPQTRNTAPPTSLALVRLAVSGAAPPAPRCTPERAPGGHLAVRTCRNAFLAMRRCHTLLRSPAAYLPCILVLDVSYWKSWAVAKSTVTCMRVGRRGDRQRGGLLQRRALGGAPAAAARGGGAPPAAPARRLLRLPGSGGGAAGRRTRAPPPPPARAPHCSLPPSRQRDLRGLRGQGRHGQGRTACWMLCRSPGPGTGAAGRCRRAPVFQYLHGRGCALDSWGQL